MPRRNLLFLTPEPSALTGGGTPMRAGTTLRALLEDYQVYALIMQTQRDPHLERLSAPLLSRCADVVWHDAPQHEDSEGELATLPLQVRRRNSGRNRLDDLSGAFPGVRFDALHVLKIYLAPFAGSLLSGASEVRCTIDLDDYESQTRRRIAELCEGEPAEEYRREAARYEALERRYLPLARTVFVCSELDRDRVSDDYGINNVRVLPNVITGDSVPRERPAGEAFTFLFPGTLDYLPNVDAAQYFVHEVLPIVRALAPVPVRILIAGRRVSPAVLALRSEDVMVEGWTEDPDSWYRRSDAVVVPLRAGGGTRIKILEAFSRGRPVVATPMAAEGLAVTDGVHLLTASDPLSFAQHCCDLAVRPDAHTATVERALAWVRQYHQYPNFVAALRGAC